MSTFLKPFEVRDRLLKKGIRIFTPELFWRIFGGEKYQVKYFLETQEKEGLFLRLKKGLYTLKTDLPNEKEIANALYKPSYISLEYALAYYGLLLESPYTITSITTKPTRLFTVNSLAYSYKSFSPKAYTGYVLKKESWGGFLIAEPEKALADYDYFCKINKIIPSDRINRTKLDKKKIKYYADLY